MIGKILGSGQLGKLASFVSPTFFEVMPAKAVWRSGRNLLARSRDSAAFRRALADRSEHLVQELPSVVLMPTAEQTANSEQPALASKQRAASIVELYFHQLFHGASTLLDLRAIAFSQSGAHLHWRPAAWIAEWSPEFLSALREIYLGFYSGDDARFLTGLRALSLEHSAELFRRQFGADQRELRFRTRDFIDTFHQVFQCCKQFGTNLHADFLPLGIYLAALYDHLQELDETVDVAAAFARATSPSASSAHEAAHA